MNMWNNCCNAAVISLYILSKMLENRLDGVLLYGTVLHILWYIY